MAESKNERLQGWSLDDPTKVGKTRSPGKTRGEFLVNIAAVGAFFLASLAGTHRKIDNVLGSILPGSAEAAEFPEALGVAEIETAFENFAQKVLAGLDRHVDSEHMRAEIREVIALFRSNRAGGSNNFTYKFDKSAKSCLATFHGTQRRITLRDDFAPDDLGAISGLGHEIRHVRHDDELRRRVPHEKYEAFYSVPDPGGAGRVTVAIPAHEAEAFAIQIEMLNVAMDGKLKADILGGREPEIPTRIHDLRRPLTRMAEEYYRNPAGYIEYMEGLYKRVRGVIRFTPDLVRIN